MLRDLHIRNLAVLAEGSIRFGPGLNILSGETGAGKSIVVDSLALLSGVRASTELIRTGTDTLVVTGVFEPHGDAWRAELEAVGVSAFAEDDLVVRREITRAGRNRVFVNDQPVTLKLLATLAPSLLRIHGQREELGLVAPELQRAWLDRCGGRQAESLHARCAAAYDAYRQLTARLEKLSGDHRARAERIDFLRFQLAEIDDAGIEAGEELALQRQRRTLRHAEAIRGALTDASDRLYEREDAAYELLEASRGALSSIVEWESDAADWVAELEELRIRAGELADTLRRRHDVIEGDPRQLDAVENRLAVLERLLRKHGETTEAVLARRAVLDQELGELDGDEDARTALASECEAALVVFRDVALALSEARGRWAQRLTERVLRELGQLALGQARFAVDLERRRRSGSRLRLDGAEQGIDFSADGIDQVVYRFSPNPGEALRSLAKVASGGELSRLYLAVQLASRGTGSASAASLVFDEVDAGVGGAEAAALGEKLKRLAAGGQVLAVTHLPQVASYADRHFKVAKSVAGGRTHTAVETLDDDQRAAEVARMLAGSEVTELSLSHARELIAAGTAVK